MKRGSKPKGRDVMGGRCPDSVKSCTWCDLKPKCGFSCVRSSHRTTPNANTSVLSSAMPPLQQACHVSHVTRHIQARDLNSSGAIQEGVPTSLLRPCLLSTASPKSATLQHVSRATSAAAKAHVPCGRVCHMWECVSRAHLVVQSSVTRRLSDLRSLSHMSHTHVAHAY